MASHSGFTFTNEFVATADFGLEKISKSVVEPCVLLWSRVRKTDTEMKCVVVGDTLVGKEFYFLFHLTSKIH